MKLKPYPKYKDSEIQWIGGIPEGWKLSKGKFQFKVTGGYAFPSDDFVDEGVPLIRIGDITKGTVNLDNCKKLPEEYTLSKKDFLLKEKDVLVAMTGATIGKIGQVPKTEIKMLLNQRVGRIKTNLSPDFYKYVLDSDFIQTQIRLIAEGSAQENISSERIESFIIPDLNEKNQEFIVNFLDKQTSKINKTIEKDKELIALLKEKRTALINHAVTKGLDPNVKLKDSEVEWIDKIPQHWLKLKGKHIGKIFNSISVDLEANSDENEQILFLQVDDLNEYIKDNIIFDSKIKFAKNHNKVYSKKMLIFPKRGAAIFTNKVNIVEKPFMCDSNLMAFQIMMGVTEYYRYQIYARRLDDIADVSTIPQINNKHIYPLAFISPPIAEQKKIVEYLDKATSQIDGVIKKIQEKIILMEEYKKSLIHHVVTGKVDVRGVEA